MSCDILKALYVYVVHSHTAVTAAHVPSLSEHVINVCKGFMHTKKNTTIIISAAMIT